MPRLQPDMGSVGGRGGSRLLGGDGLGGSHVGAREQSRPGRASQAALIEIQTGANEACNQIRG